MIKKIITFVSLIGLLVVFCAPAYSLDADSVAKKVKAVASKIKTQYSEMNIKTKIMGIESIGKARGWSKLPNKSRFEIYEPQNIASTVIMNGEDVVYINNRGERYIPNSTQRTNASYQVDFTKVLDDFELSIVSSDSEKIVLKAVPKEGTSWSNVNYINYSISPSNYLISSFEMYFKENNMISINTLAYAKDPKGITYMKKIISRIKVNASDLPFSVETITEMETTKILINAPISDSYFVVE